ncbi:urea amidolyase [Streptomyces armeniacus]|uniref:Urea amidolyase n=1 Tax=Streptomyces armeniacus TaxID=83291 RepID=A0A345Y0Q7_9ACTN|nr:urea amidolyase [Streptomyces armeniacus]
MEILVPGVQTTVQDHPGRTGLQARGFFPSGPVDGFAFRAANLLAGNDPRHAGLEITQGGFAARFRCHARAALCGAEGAAPTLGGEPVPLWQTFAVRPGDELVCEAAKGPGFRLYLAVSGGIDVPEVLGSRSVHTLAGIGGVDGRPVLRGDVLPLGRAAEAPLLRLPQSLRPAYHTHWELEVVRGPHGDPGFLTAEGWREFTSRTWRVDLNSDRLGVKLDAHALAWARPDGGVAGGHPSNVLDVSYPVGGVTVIGDVPTVLGPDGPTSGGYTVIATLAHACLWKLGQMRPGRDTVRFREISLAEADALAAHTEFALQRGRLERLEPAGPAGAAAPAAPV